MPASNVLPAACAGPRDRFGSAMAATFYGQMPRSTASRAGMRRPGKSANKPNGLTRDRQGRLLTCEHAGRRITRTEYDGTITVLIDKFDGKRLNSPNDNVVGSDDSIWFTDPLWGITSNYSGIVDKQELPTNVYRLDKTGRITLVVGDINMPDGLAFSPDETKMY